jgi:hypothetical protein
METGSTSLSESGATYGKVSELGKGLSLSKPISNQLEEGTIVTLLFEDGSTLGPTKEKEIVISPPPAHIQRQLTGVIIGGSPYLNGQWDVSSKNFTDDTYSLALSGEKFHVKEGQPEKWNLIFELTQTGYPTRRPTKRVFLHKVEAAEFSDDLGSSESGNFELLLSSIADRHEVKPAVHIQNYFAGASVNFGPIEVDLDYDIEKSRLTGDVKVSNVSLASISMGLNQDTEIKPPDVWPYRSERILLWVSPISVDVEIFYEEWDFRKFKWKKKHRERGVLILF